MCDMCECVCPSRGDSAGLVTIDGQQVGVLSFFCFVYCEL